MALRVLRTYPESNQFAAKRVRSYNGTETLNSGDELEAVEKTGDIRGGPIVAPTPSLQDNQELSELENAAGLESDTPKPDGLDELEGADAGPAPNPSTDPSTDPTLEAPIVEGSPMDEQDIDRQLEGLIIEESEDFTPTYQWLTLGAGLFKSSDFLTEGYTYFMGGGARYQIDLGHRIILADSSVQDSISLEAGVFYYTVSGYVDVDEESGIGLDSYRVIPLAGTLKYSVWLSSDLGFFAYVGLVKNLVTVLEPPADALDEEDAVALLGTIFSSAGVGGMLQIGPSWYGRVDVGTDFIGAGVMLTF